MNEPIEPLPGIARTMLAKAAPLEPPEGSEARVFERLNTSIAAVGSPLPSPAVTAMKLSTVGVLCAAVFAAGLGGGLYLGRTVLAPPAPVPVVLERIVRVEVMAPSVPLEPVLPPETPPRRREPVVRAGPKPEPALSDELLAQERELIDTSRSALLHGDASAAVAALSSHASRFPSGRLVEERESLWIQALVMQGDRAAAELRAARFHQQFARSLLGPTVDAALASP